MVIRCCWPCRPFSVLRRFLEQKAWLWLDFCFWQPMGHIGYPVEGKYMDEIYMPEWERMGTWKKVAPGENSIMAVHTPFMSRDGDLQFNTKDYLSTEKH